MALGPVYAVGECVLDMPEAMESFKFAMDRDHPGWMETTFWCRGCRQDHLLVSDEKQASMLPAIVSGAHPSMLPRKIRRLPPIKPGAPEGWCPWHETASPHLTAPCAWETCRTPLHVHRNTLGKVKSGRAGKGYVVERCPACHRYNAIHPVYGKNAISASKLEGNQPVLQLKLGRM